MTHTNFLVFTDKPTDDGSLNERFLQGVAAAANLNGYLTLSVGVEYDERRNRIVLSLGTTKDLLQDYHVKFDCINLGEILDVAELSGKMEAAAADVQNVICHEFYIDGDTYFMLLMSKVQA